MKQHFSDVTGNKIEGAIIRLYVQAPENGYALTPDESRIQQMFNNKDFATPQELAEYIMKNPTP